MADKKKLTPEEIALQGQKARQDANSGEQVTVQEPPVPTKVTSEEANRITSEKSAQGEAARKPTYTEPVEDNTKKPGYFVDDKGIPHWNGKPAADTKTITVTPRDDYKVVLPTEVRYVEKEDEKPKEEPEIKWEVKTGDNGEEIYHDAKTGKDYRLKSDGTYELVTPKVTTTEEGDEGDEEDEDEEDVTDDAGDDGDDEDDVDIVDLVRRANPEEAPVVSSTPVERSTQLQDFYRAMNSNPKLSPEQEARMKNKERRQRNLAALGDMGRAFANVIAADSGSVSWSNPATMSKAVSDKWEKWHAQQLARQEKYNAGLSNAVARDEANYIAQLKAKANADIENAKQRGRDLDREARYARMEIDRLNQKSKEKYYDAITRIKELDAKLKEETQDEEKEKLKAEVEKAKAEAEVSAAQIELLNAKSAAERESAKAKLITARANAKRAGAYAEVAHSTARKNDAQARHAGDHHSTSSENELATRKAYAKLPASYRKQYDQLIMMNPNMRYEYETSALANYHPSSGKKTKSKKSKGKTTLGIKHH